LTAFSTPYAYGGPPIAPPPSIKTKKIEGEGPPEPSMRNPLTEATADASILLLLQR
jgi:hypothetical protein